MRQQDYTLDDSIVEWVDDYIQAEKLYWKDDMGLTATSKGSDFELAPAGPQPARCYRVIDLGTQETEWQGQKKKSHKVMLTFELLGDDRMADGRPFSISKRYTLSMHEKGNLSKDLESWRGKPFSPQERQGFDISKLLGVYCLLNVTHGTGKDGTEYANIAGIMPLPKSMGKPDSVNAVVLFDLDKPDMKILEGMGERLQATIKASDEWKAQHGSGTGFENLKDDVPWEEDTAVPAKEFEF